MDLPLYVYKISSIVNFVSSYALFLFIMATSRRELRNRLFAYFCFSIGFWATFFFFLLNSNTQAYSDYFLRTCMLGVFFMSTLYIHFVFKLLYLENKAFIIFNYLLSLFFSLTVYTDYYAANSERFLIFSYFLHGRIFCLLEILHFVGLAIFGLYLLICELRKSKGIRAQQLLYIIIGTGVGYICGAMNFFSWWRIPIPPFLNIFITIYVVAVAYAIIRYHLMDVRVAITRAGIFFAVYSFVLGIPFGLAIWKQTWLLHLVGEKWFLVPMLILLALASAGPFIYQYIQRQAEKRMLYDQRRYQNTLLKAAEGMNLLKEKQRIYNLIVRLITSGVRVEYTLVYEWRDETNSYLMRSSKYAKENPNFNESIDSNSSLIRYLQEYRKVVAHDELHHNPEINETISKEQVIQNLEDLKFQDALILPIIINDKLQSVIIVGKKRNGDFYTKDDVSVLTILSNQVALAVENCIYIQAEKERLKKEGAQARRESLDMMVGTMAHEIDNPISIVVGEAEWLHDLIASQRQSISEDTLNEMTIGCDKIKDNAWRVSKIIKAVEDYSKAESGQNKAVYIDNIMIPLRSLLHLLKKNYSGIAYTEEVEPNLPPMWAEEVTIEEIIYNYVENSYHAVRRLPRGQAWVKLRIYRKEDMIVIEVSDNGYGIEPKILKQLFQVPTTTKGSTEGTGLGLYRVRQIVDKLKGRAWAESEGRDKGSKFFAEIPIFKGDPALLNKVTPRRAF